MRYFTSGTSNTTENPYENMDHGIVVENATCVHEIFAEATEDFATLESALYITDCMLEEAALEGANVEVLLENAFTNTIRTIKDKLLKLWAKIKEFFKKLAENVKIVFMKGKDFVKKYKVQILSRAGQVKTFKYKVYPYHKATIPGMNTSVDYAKNLAKAADKSKSEILEVARKDIFGNKTEAEYYTEFREALRGGDAKEEYEGFGGSSPAVGHMIKRIEEESDILKEIKKDQKDIDTAFKEAIKDCDTKSKDKDIKPEELKGLQAASAVLTLSSSVITKCINIKVDIVKEEAMAYTQILKRLVMASESKIEKVSESNSSVLESAMRFI